MIDMSFEDYSKMQAVMIKEAQKLFESEPFVVMDPEMAQKKVLERVEQVRKF